MPGFGKDVLSAAAKLARPARPETVRVSMPDYRRALTAGSESRYSSLMPWHVRAVIAAFRGQVPHMRSLLDCTAHVGMDTIAFLLNFPNLTCTAVEINPATAAVLMQNLASAGVAARSRVVVGDAVGVLRRPPQEFDVVYFDPPWGGTDYRDRGEPVTLRLGDTELSELVSMALKTKVGTVAVAKTPTGSAFDTKAFETRLQEAGVATSCCPVRVEVRGSARGEGKVSYLLWFCRLK